MKIKTFQAWGGGLGHGVYDGTKLIMGFETYEEAEEYLDSGQAVADISDYYEQFLDPAQNRRGRAGHGDPRPTHLE